MKGWAPKSLEKSFSRKKRRAVVNVGVRLNNPDKFFTWMVGAQFDCIG